MRAMRSLLLGFALALSLPAMASFDMILVADQTNSRIHRIDGDTGTYLGSFGSNILVIPNAITIDQSTSTAYVGDASSGLVAFNYNTGQVLAVNRAFTNYADLALRADGGFVRTTGAGVATASLTGSTGTLYSGAGTGSFKGVGVDGTGDVIGSDITNGRIFRWNPSGFAAPEGSTGAGTFLGVSGGSARGNTYVSLRADGRASTANTQSLSVVNNGVVAAGTWTSAADFAFGHEGFGWGVGTGTGGTRLQRYADNNGVYSPIGTGFVVSQIGTPTSIAVVVAPEPGTMLALGAGVALMLRKRRARG